MGNESSGPAETEPIQCVLLVNDDDDALFFLRRFLQKDFPTAKLLDARDGAEGLKLWSEEKIDAIITDNCMPNMTGLELTRKVRESSHVPIVMITGTEKDREEAMLAGVSVYYTEIELEGIGDILRSLWR